MFTNDWEYYAHCSRLKSTRSKTRAQKDAFDKRLIQLDKQLDRAYKAKANLGFVPLEPPVQKGWKRCFVLRPDVQRSKQAAFFQALLDKVNTVQYSSFKAFKVKKRKFGKKRYEPRPQKLKEFHECAFQKLKLTDWEKLYFKEEWRFGQVKNHMHKVYVFNEPWRFVLVIKPNMITQAKAIEPQLEQRIKEVSNYIATHHLRPKMAKLLDGSYQYRSYRGHSDKAKYDYIIAENLQIKQNGFSLEY